MSIKSESIKTITTVDAAKSIGVDEDFVIDKIKEGKILSIEAGNEITTKYYVFNDAFQKYVKETSNKLADEIKDKEMSQAASAGRKLICFQCEDFKSIPMPCNEIWISWRDALSDYNIEKIIEMSSAHFKVDLSFMKKYTIETEHFTYKISNSARSFEFIKYLKEKKMFYYIAMIKFKNPSTEKKEETAQEVAPECTIGQTS
jgi:hypothetical protein